MTTSIECTPSLQSEPPKLVQMIPSLKLGLPDEVIGLLATASLAAYLLLTSLAQVSLSRR